MDIESKPAANKKHRLAWMPLPGKGDDYLRRVADSKNEDEFLQILVEGQNAGALVVFGITDKDPKDFLACAQEFGDFRLIVDDRRYPADSEVGR